MNSIIRWHWWHTKWQIQVSWHVFWSLWVTCLGWSGLLSSPEVTWDLVRLHLVSLHYCVQRLKNLFTLNVRYLMESVAKYVSFSRFRIFCNFHKILCERGLSYHSSTETYATFAFNPLHTYNFSTKSNIYVVLITCGGMTSLWVFTQMAPSTWNTFLPLSIPF